jgi:exosortase
MPKQLEISIPKLHWPAALTPTRVAFTIKISAVFVATIAMFYQDLALLFSDALQNETTSYMLAIPLIFAYLVYRKRKMLRAAIPLNGDHQPKNTRYLDSLAGILLAATAVLLYWYGSYTFTPIEYHMLAFPLFLAGLVLVFFNPQTLRQLAFPIIFLFFLVPPPSETLYAIGSTLQVVSAEVANNIVNFLHIPSTLTMDSGSPLINISMADGTPLPPFQVDITCSGIYSLIGFSVFAVFIAYIIRDKPWKKAALILMGIPLVYLLNIVRITTMLIIGYNYGDTIALQAFHTLGGWVLIFIGTLFLLLVSEKAFKTQIFSTPQVKCHQCNPEPQPGRNYCGGCGKIFQPTTTKLHKADLAKIASIIIITVLLLTIQAPAFAVNQSTPTITVNTPSGQQYSNQIFPQTNQYTLTFLYEDTSFEARTGQDLSLVYLYAPTNESNEPIEVTLEISSTQISLHSWETCLITWPTGQGKQPLATQIDLRDITLIQNPPVISRYFAFTYTTTNETQVVLYWYATANFLINQTYQEKHVEISLLAFPSSTDELPTLQQQLVTLGTEIANYWQPAQAWSQATMLLSQNGLTLSTATSMALAATIIYYEAETRKTRKSTQLATEKLTSMSREIVKAIQETKKPATLQNIASTLQKNTGQTMPLEQLEHKLQELENTGIIRSQIYNKNDTPLHTWGM